MLLQNHVLIYKHSLTYFVLKPENRTQLLNEINSFLTRISNNPLMMFEIFKLQNEMNYDLNILKI